MKAPPSTQTLPSCRQSFYMKSRPSPPGSTGSNSSSSSSSSRRSPAKRCTPSKAAAQQQPAPAAATVPIAGMDRDLQNLLELEYQDDVRSYMSMMEARTAPSVDLIEQQPELAWYMRPYLIDFLIEVHQQHRLRPETLYLAINLVDRYVSKRVVFKKHYQLVGCAALWIAAKFEDAKDRVPTIPELSAMCCGAYDESAFIQMESHVISTLGWCLGHPTAEAWLRLSCVTGQVEEMQAQHVARFLMEITLYHKEYLVFKPSEVSMAALLLARFMTGKGRRPNDETENVLRIMRMLDQQLAEALDGISPIIIKKYAPPFYGRASNFVRQFYLSGRRFSYYDWSRQSPMASPQRTAYVATSTPTSVPLSASPSTASSRSSSIGSPASSDYDEPLTPSTPALPYDPFTAQHVHPHHQHVKGIETCGSQPTAINVTSWDDNRLHRDASMVIEPDSR